MYQMLQSSVPKTRPAQKEGPDLTGLPKQMKLEFEERSGASLDDVRVQYNSEKPAQLQALAYTQGSRIYIGPGQERHLRHELVHVIQQKQGRVQATARVNGMAVNDEERLEREADLGQIPVQMKAEEAAGIVQRRIEDDGHFAERSEYRDRMYNRNKFRWYYYLKRNQMDKGQADTTIHHIIPFEILKQFWNIIVDYYPDLWGGMVKEILQKVRIKFTSGGVYRSDYERSLLGLQNNIKNGDIEKEIDREANVLEDRAFNNAATTISQGRPQNMGDLNDLLDTVYTWMPGNLVIGPLMNNRSDDPNPNPASDAFDAPALQQKRLDPTKQKEYKDLYDQMKDFIGRGNDHQQRRTAKISGKEDLKMVSLASYIIEQIVKLLAGPDITNDTTWILKKGKYSSEVPH